jgi:ribosomal protein S18 acetylase RimI-like enzyme
MHIQKYHPARHREATLRILYENWYWVVAKPQEEAQRVGYSPEYRFNYLASTDRPEDVGKLIVKVSECDNAVTGFITYHMKSAYQGAIMCLAVDQAHRRKGHAGKLIAHAVSDLKKRGITGIELAVRADNEPACALYERFGFKEHRRVKNRFGSFIVHQLDVTQ